MAGWTPVTEDVLKSSQSAWTPVDESAPKKEANAGYMSGLNIGENLKEAEKQALLNVATFGMAAGYQTYKSLKETVQNAKKNFQAGQETAKDIGITPNNPAAGPIAAANVLGPMVGMNPQSVRARASRGDTSGILGETTIPTLSALVAPKLTEKLTAAGNRIASSGAPEFMYQSALKPPPASYTPKEVASMVKTGLTEEIPVSAGGASKLSGLIDDVNSKIKAQISAGASAGANVNKFSVASRLKGTANKFSTQVNPAKDLSAISESGNEFLESQPNQIPLDKAQALKQGTYAQLKDRSYGELSSATKESQKALARGLKEEIATQFPEIAELNARDSKLINLDGALERAVNRIGNHQLLGLGTPAAAGAVGVVTKSSAMGAVAGILKAVVDDPLLKSQIAIALNRKGVAMPTARQRIGAYVAGLSAASAAQNSGQQGEQ